MINSQTPSNTPRKASLDLRKELLNALGVPLGTATVARRPTPMGDTLVVRMTVPELLPADRRPSQFRGIPVAYEVVKPLKISHRR